MPMVPYTPAPSVSPQTSSPIGYQSSAAGSPDAFGASVGEATSRLGGSVQQFGNMLDQHAIKLQDLANQSAAKEMFVSSAEALGQLTTQYSSLEGKAAVDAYPKYAQDVQALREKMRSQAPNAEVARIFDNDFSRRAVFSIIDGSRHAAQQNKVYNNGVADAVVKNTISDTAASAHDNARFDDNVKLATGAVDQQAAVHGWSPEETAMKKGQVVGSLWATRVQSLAMTDPFSARALYEKAKDSIPGDIQLKIEKNLQQQDNAVGTRIVADRIVNGGSGDAASMLRRFEGFKSSPYWDVNANRIGYGSDTITKEDGSVVKVAPGMSVTKDDAERDLTRRIGQTQQTIKGQVGDEAWGKLSASTQAALTSVGYNYGSLPASVSAAVKSGDNEAIAKAIEGHAGDNGGVNANRRRQEAAAVRGGNGLPPLTPDSQPGWLGNALQVAKDEARRIAPNNPQFEDLLQARVQAEYNNVKTAKNETDLANFNSLQGAVIGDGQTHVTSMDQIFSNAALNQSFQALPPARQQQIMSQVNRNAKADVPLTPERYSRFQELMGQATTDPAEFQKVVVGDEDLPRTLQSQLFNKQRSLQGKLQDTSKVNSALRTVAPMLSDAGVVPSRSDPDKAKTYNQFVGAFGASLQEFEQEKKRFPNEQEQTQMAAGLLRKTKEAGFFFGSDERAFQVPDDFAKTATDTFKGRYHREPTPSEIYTIYQRSLKASSGGNNG